MIGAGYALPVDIPGLQFFQTNEPFITEGSAVLGPITIAYHTYGQLNAAKDNVIWVCHALTANSRVDDWWSGIFGEGKVLDPTRYFIVCANVLGSCYGSTSARSIYPDTAIPYGLDWPLITVRDWVRAHDMLRVHLGIEQIALCIGGSSGGHQVLEYALLIPDRIKHIGLLVTSARESAWAIAGHEAQRMALQADPTFFENKDNAGEAGLMAARGIALLGYRTAEAYIATQTDQGSVIQDHRASTYIRYQGDKLRRRFYAHCYYHLLRSLDTHNIGRGRGSIESVLQSLPMRATIISIDTDRLIPPDQQLFLAKHIPKAKLHTVHSDYGHDGFLIEFEAINAIFLRAAF
jgi:homoserine O-acetyltransferase